MKQIRMEPEGEKKYLRGNPGRLSPDKQLEYGLELLRERRIALFNTGKVPRNLSYRKIAVKIGVFSPTTVMNWDHQDMSPDAILYRSRLKAADRKFTIEEEEIMAGWIVYQDLSMQSTTTLKFREFVYDFFGELISPSFISKFLNRHQLSMKLVGNASAKEIESREEVIQEGVDFLNSLALFISRYNITSEQIKVFDKTYLATSPWHKYVKQICMKGSVKSRKLTPDQGPSKYFLDSLIEAGLIF